MAAADDSEATDIDVEAELPDREAHRLDDQRRILRQTMDTLAELAVSRHHGGKYR